MSLQELPVSEPQPITRLLLDWSQGDELALFWFTTSCESWPPAISV